MTLSDYVKKRNGVPLGSNKSLRNMLDRSLGAGSFSKFWTYWNPIWGYYLAKYFYKPLKSFLQRVLSIILTFTICGFIHDSVIMLLRSSFEMIITQWFLLMGICVVVTEFLNIKYEKLTWIKRASINLIIISGCLLLAYQFRI